MQRDAPSSHISSPWTMSSSPPGSSGRQRLVLALPRRFRPLLEDPQVMADSCCGPASSWRVRLGMLVLFSASAAASSACAENGTLFVRFCSIRLACAGSCSIMVVILARHSSVWLSDLKISPASPRRHEFRHHLLGDVEASRSHRFWISLLSV